VQGHFYHDKNGGREKTARGKKESDFEVYKKASIERIEYFT
jgi:hypothetical protein